MSSPEFTTFTPNESIVNGIVVRVPIEAFPLRRLVDLIGVPLDVLRLESSAHEPNLMSIYIAAATIPGSLRNAGVENYSFWEGLAVGLHSNPYYEDNVPYVIFGSGQGELS